MGTHAISFLRRAGRMSHGIFSDRPFRPPPARGENGAMTTPRSRLVDAERACGYHLVSRCVRRSWLCGRDPLTGRDYSRRRRWLVDRLRRLAGSFAVELHAYAVMSNHFHLVVHYDPKACESWSAGEVARRWVAAFPPKEEERRDEQRELLASDPERVARARRALGSLSSFMQHLKQPIARRANREDGCTGHFFEQRFYSGALLSDAAVEAAMAYVDLNPVRAGIAARLAECRDASIGERLERLGRVRENSAEALEEHLRPVASGLAGGGRGRRLARTLAAYVARLKALAEAHKAQRAPAEAGGRPAAGTPPPEDGAARWMARVSALGRTQRAYGTKAELARWASERGLQPRELALPA